MSERVPAAKAGDHLPHKPGLYAVFVDDMISLPEPFDKYLAAKASTDLLYIGKTGATLHQRVWIQEFQHRSPGTFFRSIGVMLGYRSPKGGKNFEFSVPDKAMITAWIKQHLSVAWTASLNDLGLEESAAIRHHRPLLNLKGNPDKLALLSKLRAKSQAGSGTARHIGRVSPAIMPR